MYLLSKGPYNPYINASSSGGKELTGVRNGITTWRLQMPNDATISTIASYSYPMSWSLSSSTSILRRPAPVHVTGSRQLLHKYVDEDTILVLAHDRNNAELHALIVDATTGNLYDERTHSSANPPVSAVCGYHCFVYTFWNSAMVQQELQVIDMYEEHPSTNTSSWVGHTVRAAVRALFGREIMSALGIPDPEFPIACRPPPSVEQLDEEQQAIVNRSSSSSSNADPHPAMQTPLMQSRSIRVSDCVVSDSRRGSERTGCASLEYRPEAAGSATIQCMGKPVGDVPEYHVLMEILAKRKAGLSPSSVSGVANPSFEGARPTPFTSTLHKRRPALVRSGVSLTKRVTRLDVTQTARGITQTAVIMTLESGQVALLPKKAIDTRRPGTDNMPPYEPVVFLESAARRSS